MQASLLTNANRAHYLPAPGVDIGIELLRGSARDEVLAFLESPLIHTAYLSGLIRDNGMVSPLNRGIFYGYRNCFGLLEGVALIGHAILMETASDRALQAFAETAQQCKTHIIVCEEDSIDKFWGYYSPAGQQMRRICRELMFELRWPVEVSKQQRNLRLATHKDLNLLIPVHAEMVRDESGIDPRDHDAVGFADRYARRIQKGRTWILTADDKLIFKAEVVAESPETTYLEGVWVNPDLRRQGYGRTCMSQLARVLLWRTKSICLIVNDENEPAQSFYKQAGYHLRNVYDTIYLT